MGDGDGGAVGAVRLLAADREFAALAGTAFARAQAYSTVLIALALYADLFGTTGTVEGLFGTAFAAVQLLVVVPLGRRVDAGDAKRYLLAGLLVNVAVFCGFVLVENAVHVILVRMVQGVGSSLVWVTGSAVVGDISPEDGSGRWLGAYNQVGAFSSLAGDLLGGYLLYAHGFGPAFAALTLVTLGATVLVFLVLRSDPGGGAARGGADEGAIWTLLENPTVRALVVFRTGFSAGKMIVIIFLPILAATEFGITAFAIGWILAGGKLTKSLLQGWLGAVSDRVAHPYRLVAGGAVLYGVAAAAVPLARLAEGAVTPVEVSLFGDTQALGGAFVALWLAYALAGVGDSVRLPASMSLFVEEGERLGATASAMSLRSVSWKVGQVAGPFLAGVVTEFVSTDAAFLVAAAMIFGSTVVYVVTHVRLRGSGQPAAAD